MPTSNWATSRRRRAPSATSASSSQATGCGGAPPAKSPSAPTGTCPRTPLRRRPTWSGGDELFAGYRRHVGLLAAERYGRLPRALRAAAAILGESLPDALGSELAVDRVKRFLRAGVGPTRATPDRYFDLQCRANDALRERLYAPAMRDAIAGNGARERFRHLHQTGSREGLAAALYLDYKTYLADDILALSDRL